MNELFIYSAILLIVFFLFYLLSPKLYKIIQLLIGFGALDLFW